MGKLDLRAARQEPGAAWSSDDHTGRGKAFGSSACREIKALNSPQVMLSPTRALGVGRMLFGGCKPTVEKRRANGKMRKKTPGEEENSSNTPQ